MTAIPPAPTAEEMRVALRALRDELALQAGEPPGSRDGTGPHAR